MIEAALNLCYGKLQDCWASALILSGAEVQAGCQGLSE